MSHLCCPICEVRFSPAAATYLMECPDCGGPPVPVENLRSVVGFRLEQVESIPDVLSEVLAVPFAIPPYDGIRGPGLDC